MGSYPTIAVKMRFLCVAVFMCLAAAAYALPQGDVKTTDTESQVSDVVKKDGSSAVLTTNDGETAALEGAEMVEMDVKKVKKGNKEKKDNKKSKRKNIQKNKGNKRNKNKTKENKQ